MRKPQSTNEYLLNINGTLTDDKKLIADTFKSTFTSKVHKLRKEPNSAAIIDRLKEHLGAVESWDLRECTAEEVATSIDKLSYSASSGPDGVSNRTLKNLKFEIIPALTKIINCSINSGIFPQIWKTSRVCPIFKNKGSKEDADNYRPISLTSNIGKLVEAVIRI